MNISIDTKVCTKCKLEHPLTEYNQRGSGRPGARTVCKACCKKINAQWRIENYLEREKERSKDPAFKARRCAQYRANPERAKKTAREWYKNNAWKTKARAREWGKQNPDKIAAGARTRRARKANTEGSHTASDVRAIRKTQNNKCALCKIPLGRHGHLDHIHPLSKGGTNWPRNLQWLCEHCNKTKAAKDPIDFSREIGLLL